jgi:hypothetical protein
MGIEGVYCINEGLLRGKGMIKVTEHGGIAWNGNLMRIVWIGLHYPFTCIRNYTIKEQMRY